VLVRSEWHPTERVWLLGHAKVDLYTSSDTVKGRGLDVTEAWVQGRWEGDTLGTGVMASHFTWPELRRVEYEDLPPELVSDGVVQRLSWHGSWRVAEPLSLRLRADVWRDQDHDGDAFAVDVDWRSLWSARSALAVSAFVNDGGTVAGPGARVQLLDALGDLAWRLSYRFDEYESAGLGGSESWVRQSVELGGQWPIGRGGDLDLTAERWFGDREDSLWLGLYVQWRF
jgi:hypothetical protein